jgi:hypothetical protein
MPCVLELIRCPWGAGLRAFKDHATGLNDHIDDFDVSSNLAGTDAFDVCLTDLLASLT